MARENDWRASAAAHRVDTPPKRDAMSSPGGVEFGGILRLILNRVNGAGRGRAGRGSGTSVGSPRQGGVLPGSMGTSSFHVEGRGHEPALYSSAHGAGRALSRAAAELQRDVNLRRYDPVPREAQSVASTRNGRGARRDHRDEPCECSFARPLGKLHAS